MNKIFTFAILVFGIPITGQAQTPEWSTSVASILYTHCAGCHHEGGIAPFALMSYDDAVSNAFNIQADVNAGKMPPWPPDPGYSHFRDEKILSDDDKAAINNWVNGGLPSGDLSFAPPPPVFDGAAFMQQVDDTIELPS